ncbi:BglG family transcription antiterminator [Aerococcus loyolae]|uniref:BglG family transcription antiterminator n=1 Tax=Aerococcus loyolae TaxID=2976809 RepID=A0ABT4BYG0_9LACT|nr:BglG family transcription antiterminator [Aerococcus loyolae]MCY3025292.1 BglG family transcription antiterminator [Aerococcus loyolae]MCY3027794.1 BglG family transcription antiterminator [Aerococcus loyolae]MCY3029171.1 BglG family transcription antiterminator [Aerococcus loyolae]
MLDQRSIDIVRILMKQTEDYITAQEIAGLLNVSDRTIRNTIKSLKGSLEDYGAEIKSKRGKGYYLQFNNKKLFNQYFQTEISQKKINTASDRQNFILKGLLLNNRKFAFDSLLAELSVSESTLQNDLAKIKEKLSKYQLCLHNQQQKGIYITGKEENKRKFIINYFFISNIDAFTEAFPLYSSLLEGIPTEKIITIIIEEVQKENLELQDYVLYNLFLHIALAIKRLEMGYSVEEENVSYYPFKANIATNIVNRLESELNISLPKVEIEYISIALGNTASQEGMVKDLLSHPKELEKIIKHLIESVFLKTGFPFYRDSVLLNSLMSHMQGMLNRIEKKHIFKNPLLNEIKNEDSQLFLDIKSSIHAIDKWQHLVLSDDEIAFIALHFLAAKERSKRTLQINALVVCASGIGSAEMLKQRLINEYGNYMHVKDTIGYFEINNEALKDVDIIISAIDLSGIIFNVPVVNVSILLSDEDKEKIDRYLKGIKREKERSHLNSDDVWSSLSHTSLLFTYLKPNLFTYYQTETSKENVIVNLLDRIQQVEPDFEKGKMLDQLAYREKFGSVAFSKVVAVPHPINAVSKETHIGVAICQKGIYWDKDHPAIRLVFLLSPSKMNQDNIDSLSRLLLPLIEDTELASEIDQKHINNFDHFIKWLKNKIH